MAEATPGDWDLESSGGFNEPRTWTVLCARWRHYVNTVNLDSEDDATYIRALSPDRMGRLLDGNPDPKHLKELRLKLDLLAGESWSVSDAEDGWVVRRPNGESISFGTDEATARYVAFADPVTIGRLLDLLVA